MHNLEKLIGRYLPENPVIVEAGACDGTDTIELSQLWPSAKIYAFEPNPKSYRALKNLTASNPNISTFNMALGDRSGFTDFYVSRYEPSAIGGKEDMGQASSILPASKVIWHEPHTSFESPIQVPMTTLDDWAEENGIKAVDFLWLDMQGAEGLALLGCPKILKTVKAIQTEFFIRPYYEGCLVLEELHTLMVINGFKLIFEFGTISGDYIYVRI